MENTIKPIDARSIETTVKGGPWLLTGPSGSGKDYVIDNFAKKLEFQALDDLGMEVGEKWLIDVKKINQSPQHTRVFGTADNLVEVVNTIMGYYKPGAKLKVIIVRPTPDLYRQAVSAKLRDKVGSDQSKYATKWVAKAKMSDAKLNEYFDNWIANFVKKLPADSVIYQFSNSLQPGERVERGWHGSSSGRALRYAESQKSDKS